ncbi:MAG TPA: hypothetical protein VMA35_04700 [Candidatus Sulfopaludibacter sp.]|nr:hypothetical protein [Candidatus Sulfopaludibacter sp.]
MNLFFVHERFGAFTGARSNILAMATAFNQRGHVTGPACGMFAGKGKKPSVGTFHHCFPLAGAAWVKRLPATKRDLPPARCEVYVSGTKPTSKTNGSCSSVLARPALQVVLQNKFTRSSDVPRIKQNEQGGKESIL